jgi:hypothetical protein
MTDTSTSSKVSAFDEERAATLVGKSILIGLTYFDRDGAELRRTQLHGVVASASTTGVLISLRGTREGQSFNLPPDLDAISEAVPGSYRLRETGEVVEAPNLVSTWDIRAPLDESSNVDGSFGWEAPG